MYALVDDGVFIRWVTLSVDYPHTSFPNPVTQDCLPTGVVMVQHTVAPENIGRFQRAEKDATPTLIDGYWQLGYTLYDMSEVEIEQVTQTEQLKVRTHRNFLLSQSDWSQGKDIQDSVSTPWAVYRQALRDVPAQEGFPWEVVWPVAPG